MAEHTGEHHIEVDDLMVHYGDVTAIKGVSFAVRWGEHLTLLGPSGCGKTIILRAIAGLEQPSAGEIRIGGRSSIPQRNVSMSRLKNGAPCQG
jgi:ABC-type Fe3+/spermidine/putrescine transport system ATPase subunit